VSKIVEFPSNEKIAWKELEALLARIVRKAGVKDEVATRMAGNIRPLFEVLCQEQTIQLALPESCAAEFEKQQHLIHELFEKRNSDILGERIKREIEACKECGVL
jgi:hypothetical protein